MLKCYSCSYNIFLGSSYISVYLLPTRHLIDSRLHLLVPSTFLRVVSIYIARLKRSPYSKYEVSPAVPKGKKKIFECLCTICYLRNVGSVQCIILETNFVRIKTADHERKEIAVSMNWLCKNHYLTRVYCQLRTLFNFTMISLIFMTSTAAGGHMCDVH